VSAYVSTSVDRRAEYYARSAAVIAADPLDFYTRAEAGRRYQFREFRLPYEIARMARLTAESLRAYRHNADGIRLAAQGENA
jgi:hypothetical protein